MSLSSARRRVAALAAPMAGLLLLGGCSTTSDDPEATSRPTPTAVAELEPGSMEVPRLDFCDLVDDAAVRAALDAAPEDATARSPGEAAATDESPLQEIGCAWSAGTTTARAWVFATPVSERLARAAVREAEQRRGCRTTPSSYGAPSVRQECTVEDRQRLRYAGRFGDTWLSCELEAPELETARTDAWCAAVANALDAGR
jgi:hypothetical protein